MGKKVLQLNDQAGRSSTSSFSPFSLVICNPNHSIPLLFAEVVSTKFPNDLHFAKSISTCICGVLFFLINLFIYIYFWLRWVFIAALGLSLVVVSRGYSLLQCAGFSLWWFLLLRSMSSRCMGFSSCGTRAQ